MNSRKDVEQFLGHKTLAFIGLSRDPRSFSAQAYQDLKTKGYRLYPIDSNTRSINGETCYQSVKDLPGKPGGAILFTPRGAPTVPILEAST
jgi:predicted CoA-binding protein